MNLFAAAVHVQELLLASPSENAEKVLGHLLEIAKTLPLSNCCQPAPLGAQGKGSRQSREPIPHGSSCAVAHEWRPLLTLATDGVWGGPISIGPSHPQSTFDCHPRNSNSSKYVSHFLGHEVVATKIISF